MFRVIIAGGRNFNNYPALKQHVAMLLEPKKDVVIVSGTAAGADKLGEQYALEHKLACRRYPANWKRYGRSAGYKRNLVMAENADALIAFWDGKSRGTKLMIDIAKERKLPFVVIDY